MARNDFSLVKIDLKDVNWRSIDINLKAGLYQTGVVDLTLFSTDSPQAKIHLPVNQLSSVNRSEFPPNTTNITISVCLSNGHGNLAWQHAQIFRQSIDRESKAHSFLVRILT